MTAERARLLVDAPENPRGDYVLYWMIAARRSRWSFALDLAVDAARRLDRPLLVLEALRVGYPWASDRLHAYVMRGMDDNAAAFAKAGVTYWPYVEPSPGAGKGLLQALAARACLVVTDDFPAFFLPRMLARAAEQVSVRFVAVDGNGLFPMRRVTEAPATAYAFRRILQRALPEELAVRPKKNPFARMPVRAAELPRGVARKWPAGTVACDRLPIDHGVPPVAEKGGPRAAAARLRAFIASDLPRYADERNDPDADVASGLSAYLHFGHLSSHEVFWTLAEREDWDLSRIGRTRNGQRDGFWGLGAPTEKFLDEIVTWRELGFVWAANRADYDSYESLPEWAKKTLKKHGKDRRAHVYGMEELEAAETYDELWNAAQRQLVAAGRIHNYLRMLWGKKILEWSATPKAALAAMVHLNNKYAVDGRNPNSYTGILWVLGRHDRPWGPERPVYGTVRYMSSDNTRRKLDVTAYLERWGGR